MLKQYRQGDILLEEFEALPEGAKAETPAETIVLALGEATGHSHRLSGSHASAFLWRGVRFVEVKAETELIHEEHAPISLKPALYRIVRQREYDPFRARPVSD